MSIFNGLNINATGLSLERLKLDTISTNIANINTNATADTPAYRKKQVVFSENLKSYRDGLVSSNPANANVNRMHSFGVQVDEIAEDDTVKLSYDPTNPAADANGYVQMSNVNVADEMVDMIQALRTYQANAAAVEMNKNILRKALEISKN
ncbi:flagellar basal body rod protein FlgC [Enterococcus columbae]|uniref:Flagellar basal-body rod protein FlgC n=1 Tax=Enterococcus columbae DSM 7374 = ATCC 51263 TaxID=1121865 RepID=S0K677_9ENTE|nr:flagellar basal body rod protein FlgC [Enterococcus columbae]EOT40012.1 flagellar basal-body rod protein FlgC [Enterococcus columbae DSM 7374 = ATCC 51263]EOW83997.1 flagellar basal-body rod protein FlgC [Enterococcus columbae DSM 7374 = ATCC 51263]OJG25784.1 flagellar basal-body rod protein FlgC [Enterococcus columbae DSM 7374 = ATCC 51263]